MALGGLAAFDDPALIERTLGLVLDGTIKGQDLRYLFPGIGLRPGGREVVHAWIEKHFDELARLYPSYVMGRVVRTVPALCDAGRVRAAEAFLRPRVAKLEAVEKDLRQSVEEGLRCAALAEAARAEAARWFRGRPMIRIRMRGWLGAGLARGRWRCTPGATRRGRSPADNRSRIVVPWSDQCVPTWEEASGRTAVCAIPAYALLRADCGGYHVLAVHAVDASRSYYYDAASGTLVAIVSANGSTGTTTCIAGPAGGFTLPTCTGSVSEPLPQCPDGGADAAAGARRRHGLTGSCAAVSLSAAAARAAGAGGAGVRQLTA